MVAGPFARADAEDVVLAAHRLDLGQGLRAAPPKPGGTAEKLTSTVFLLGTDGLQLEGRVEGLQLAVVDDGDAVAELVGLVHVVRGQEDGEIALGLDLAQHLPDRHPRHRVEAGGGLVEEEDPRLVHEAAGDLHAPAHAAGEVLHRSRPPLGELHGREQLVDQPDALAPAARRRASRR